MKLFLLQVIEQPIKFHIFNLYLLNHALLFEMFTVSVAYIIVLVQYEMDPKD